MIKIKTRGMETWSRLTAIRGEGRGRGDWWEEGEGISHRTYMKDPWV